MVLLMFQQLAMIKILIPTITHINSETDPPCPIINIVCEYLRQFLSTSFGVAILPICSNIDEGGGV